jgi:hypothetical protein
VADLAVTVVNNRCRTLRAESDGRAVNAGLFTWLRPSGQWDVVW